MWHVLVFGCVGLKFAFSVSNYDRMFVALNGKDHFSFSVILM